MTSLTQYKISKTRDKKTETRKRGKTNAFSGFLYKFLKTKQKTLENIETNAYTRLK